MKKNKQVLKLLSVVLIFLSGCTIYERNVPIIKVADFYDFRAQAESLEIIADFYGSSGKIVNIFGVDLRKQDVLPLHLIIENKGQTQYDLSQLRVSFKSVKTGHECELLDPREVSQKTKYNTAARMILFGAVGSPVIILALPFALSAGLSTADANRRMEQDFENQQEIETIIRPKEMVNGFLFFDVPAHGSLGESAIADNYLLKVSGIVNKATQKNIDVEIPIYPSSDWLR